LSLFANFVYEREFERWNMAWKPIFNESPLYIGQSLSNVDEWDNPAWEPREVDCR
jgi:hypothetical protein